MEKKLRVLLAEDSEVDAFLLMRALQNGGYDVFSERVSAAAKMAEALKLGTWDIVISDYSMPSFGGLEALKIAQDSGLDLPFIILSGAIGEETAVAAMKAGAHDFVMKDRLARLVPAVERELREARSRRERREADERLKRSLREKEVLLKEIHHRVKNNLQIISSLLRLQSRRITDPVALKAFSESQNRIRSIALIHEKLYLTNDLSEIDFTEYVRSLTLQLFRSYGASSENIRLVLNLEPLQLSVDMAFPCGLILNEVVSNALKHAFPGGSGELQVNLVTDREREEIVLSILDNGKGFDHNSESPPAESLGLQLISDFANQLRGTYELRSLNGTQFKLVFRAPHVKDIGG